jgi:hypothetical protein
MSRSLLIAMPVPAPWKILKCLFCMEKRVPTRAATEAERLFERRQIRVVAPPGAAL